MRPVWPKVGHFRLRKSSGRRYEQLAEDWQATGETATARKVDDLTPEDIEFGRSIIEDKATAEQIRAVNPKLFDKAQQELSDAIQRGTLGPVLDPETGKPYEVEPEPIRATPMLCFEESGPTWTPRQHKIWERIRERLAGTPGVKFTPAPQLSKDRLRIRYDSAERLAELRGLAQARGEALYAAALLFSRCIDRATVESSGRD